MRVGMRSEHAGDQELRLREMPPEHRHERDRAALPHRRHRLAVERVRGLGHRALEPRRRRRGVPAARRLVGRERRPSRRQGGSASSRRFRSAVAVSPSSVGGRRSDSLSEVFGRSTLPALAIGGKPSAPVTDSAGRQVRLSSASVWSATIGCVFPANGYLSHDEIAEDRGGRRRLRAALVGNRRVELGRKHPARRGILEAVEQPRARSGTTTARCRSRRPSARPRSAPPRVSVPAASPRSDVVAHSRS